MNSKMHMHVLAPALLGIAASTLGCDPSMYDFRVFDDLADDTWVHASGPPDNMVGDTDYGFAMAGGQTTDGARLYVAGRGPDGFAYLHYNLGGDLEGRTTSVYDVNTLDQANRMPDEVIMIADPTSSQVAVGLSNGGSPAAPTQSTVALLDAANGQTSALIALPGNALVTGLVFGQTSAAGSGARSVIALRGNLVTVIADIANPSATAVPTCRHDGDVGLSVVAADLDPTLEFEEIAFAVSSAAGAKVHVVTGSLVSDADVLAVPPDPADCFDPVLRQPLATLDAPGGEADFGDEMLVADLNGNSVPDLVISAPSTGTVYVYFDVDASAGVPAPIVLTAPAEATAFGTAMTAGDLDADGADELVIGAPDTNRDKDSAGAAYLYDPAGQELGEPVAVLGDAQPEANQRFGLAMAVVPFAEAGDEILVVGAKKEIFTYFRTPISEDVRVGAD